MYGVDINSLEASTKDHYIYFFDPQYVKEKRTPEFDEHIDMSILSKRMSIEDGELFKSLKKKIDKSEEEVKIFLNLNNIRSICKNGNFASVYGAGPPKIAKTMNIPLNDAKNFHKVYWQRNKAVKDTEIACKVKEVDGRKWLYNPISGFWMYLVTEKDKFSTLNQSSGVYVFDTYLRYVRNMFKPLDIKMGLQYHFWI
jgi:hypothetical protein